MAESFGTNTSKAITSLCSVNPSTGTSACYLGLQPSVTSSCFNSVNDGLRALTTMMTSYAGTAPGSTSFSTSSCFNNYDAAPVFGGSSTAALPSQPGSTSVIGGLMSVACGEPNAGNVGSYLTNFGVNGTGLVGGTANLSAGGGLHHPLASGCRSIISSSDLNLQPMIGYRRPFTTAKPPYSYISLITMAIQVGV